MTTASAQIGDPLACQPRPEHTASAGDTEAPTISVEPANRPAVIRGLNDALPRPIVWRVAAFPETAPESRQSGFGPIAALTSQPGIPLGDSGHEHSAA